MPDDTDTDTAASAKAAIPARQAEQLRRLTTRIAAVDELWDVRAREMNALWEQGFTLQQIGEACGMSRAAVHKSVHRWRARRSG